MYTSIKIAKKSTKWEIDWAETLSDHRMVSMEFYPRHKTQKGPGVWMMNTNLLYHNKARIALENRAKSLIEELTYS